MAWKINQSESDTQEMQKVMELLGESTASKAIIRMLHRFIGMNDKINSQAVQINELERKYSHLARLTRQKLELESSIVELVEH